MGSDGITPIDGHSSLVVCVWTVYIKADEVFVKAMSLPASVKSYHHGGTWRDANEFLEQRREIHTMEQPKELLLKATL